MQSLDFVCKFGSLLVAISGLKGLASWLALQRSPLVLIFHRHQASPTASPTKHGFMVSIDKRIPSGSTSGTPNSPTTNIITSSIGNGIFNGPAVLEACLGLQVSLMHHSVASRSSADFNFFSSIMSLVFSCQLLGLLFWRGGICHRGCPPGI